MNTQHYRPRAAGATEPDPPKVPWLDRYHGHMLVTESGIDLDVIRERGYRSLDWTLNDQTGRRELAGLKVPSWARPEKAVGLLIPVYRATGERIGVQWRPDKPTADRQGRKPKYVMPSGTASKLDVHPRNRSRIADPTVELWITEGIKKADALTSRGTCVVALAGVYNWRAQLGTLGDWEDVPLRGRSVVVCFDADALTKPAVLRAMHRLGRWLRSKGAKPLYLVTPGKVGDRTTKGADDYLAAGGTIEALRAVATTTEPNVRAAAGGGFSDARMADQVADDVLDGCYLWCKALGWLGWDGRRWDVETTEEQVIEDVRRYILDRYADAVKAMKSEGMLTNTVAAAAEGYGKLLSRARLTAVVGLTRGIVERRADAFDADPDILNTPSGIADLITGDLFPHDPDQLCTKITRGAYRPDMEPHHDWVAALTALPDDCRRWWQARIGQAVTGRPTPDGVLVVAQGGGENGKSLLTTDGVVPALGDYADVASSKLIEATKGTEHSTEMADLRGKRLLNAEEMTEGRALNVTMIKRIMDVGTIRARYVHRDNMTFRASHSLFATTNYIPVVNEVDHGTWRRLALLVFPYRFVTLKPGAELELPGDRRGDPGLKERIKAGDGGQHDAIVTWAVEGAVRVAKDGAAALASPDAVKASTTAWRATADRILAFWGDRLTADPGACVLAGELLDEFNAWLAENGHQSWSKETFSPRFETHIETRKNGVEARRTTKLDGLQRRPQPAPTGWLVGGPTVKTGTRTAVRVGRRALPASGPKPVVTRANGLSLAEVAEPLGNPSRGGYPRKFPGPQQPPQPRSATRA